MRITVGHQDTRISERNVKIMESSQCSALRSFQAQREHGKSHGDVVRKRRKEHPGKTSQQSLGTK